MAEYSKQHVLDRFSQASHTNGWGAVLAIGRTPLERLLEQQYLQSFGQGTFIRPYQGQVAIDEGGVQVVGMDGLVLGPPQLSFENATMTNGVVNVRMNLIAGDFNHLRRSGNGMQLAKSQSITEGMGYWLDAKVELTAQVAAVGRRIKVGFDLAKATDITCNLGDTEYARRMIGRRLQAWIEGENAIGRTFTLADFDLRNYSPVVPNQVLARSQRAPWAGDTPGAQGEGALVLFMQLNSDLTTGMQPDRDFPYLLANEADIDSALLADSYFDDLESGDPAGTLGSLSLTNGASFNPVSSAKARDLLVFGKIEDGPRTLSPALDTVISGKQRQFALGQGNGAIDWDARNLYRPLASGTLDAQGLYEARPHQDFVKEVQVGVVTGKYQTDEESQRRAALLIEHLSGVMVAPRVVTWGAGLPDVELLATSIQGASLQWSLVGDTLGELKPQEGGRALFAPTPPATPTPEIRLQRIRVTDGTDSAEACVVIVAWAGMLDVQPCHVPRQDAFAPIDFKSPLTAKAGNSVSAAPTWTVFGEGTIDSDGRYTPPAVASTPCSVVMADFMNTASGYAIIEHGQRQSAPSSALNSWYELDVFYLKVISAPQCYANGLQQIEVQVTLKPKEVDGVVPPISDTELASLRFHFERGDGVVRELLEGEDGIEPSPNGPGTWVMNRHRNESLDMQVGNKSDQDPQTHAPGEVILRYWLQTTSTSPETFYMAIQQDGAGGIGGRWITSSGVSLENGKITVQGMPLPPSIPELLGFESQRVRQEGEVLDNDPFSYMSHTIDYWRLSYFKGDPVVPFVALDIEPSHKKSLLRWSSAAFDDEYCSYTGFMFGEGTANALTYDGTLCRLASERGIVLDALEPGQGPAPGTLLLALSRTSNFRLRSEQTDDPDNLTDSNRKTRDALDEPFRFRLIDRQGNRHRLQIVFEGARQERNALKVQTQPLNP
ncbi:hypothetical protein PS910_00054 [Pseudomonas fluorescens]|nr:hypothetical protein PS910_00054 [Pseudomonas fluorescens]